MSAKCVYVEGCSMYNHLTTAVRIIQLQPFLREYCLNGEHYRNCERYKIKEKGSEAPENLLPDGTILKT